MSGVGVPLLSQRTPAQGAKSTTSGRRRLAGRRVGRDLERRPETLSLEEFARMSDAFVRMGEGEA